MITKPVYMGIQDAVIKTQPIRPLKLTAPLEAPASRVEHEKEDKTAPEEKPQTRIPVSRFKPAVERVQRERRGSKDANEQKRQAPEKPRRSSIPKLRVPVTRKAPTDDDSTVKTDKEPVNKPNDETPVKTIERKPIRRDRIPVMRKDHYKIVKRDDNAKKQEEITNTVKHEESVKTDSKEKLDEEFDKLYGEIVDADVSLPDEILETKLKDPEKLESKFEEIVHQYDDDTVEQVRIEPVDKARYSKIPLLRRRSSQDIKIPKQSERKLALKISDKSIKRDDEKFDDTKLNSSDDDSKPNSVGKDDKTETIDNNEDEGAQENSLEVNNNNEGHIIIHSPNHIPDFNTIPTPECERVKVGIFEMSTREIPIEDSTNQNVDVTTPVLETVKLAEIDIPVEDSLNSINSYVEAEVTKPSDNIDTEMPINEVQNDTINSVVESELVKDVDDVISTVTNDIETDNLTEVEVKNDVEDPKETITIPITEGDNINVTTPVLETVKLTEIDIPVEDSLNSINSYVEAEVTKPSDNIDTEMPTNEVQNDTINSVVESELVKDDDVISTVTNDIETDNQTEVEVKNDVEDPKETITIPITEDDATAQSLENHTTKHQNDIIIPLSKPNDELKSVSLLQKVNSVEERTKSRYIIKPLDKVDDNTKTTVLEEEIPTVKEKVSGILKRFTSPEPSNNDISKNNDNGFKKEEINTMKIDEDIPKKKSVLSKIAMFERAEPAPPLVKKPVNRYSKPKRTISEEIRHSPKIVQEVLKPKGTEQTDKHTLVTVDIIQPIEVVTNNEEQVPVVENLKENTIEFENLDHDKLNRTDTIQTRLKELSDTPETISREDNRLYVAEPEELKGVRKISVTRDKLLEDDLDTTVPKYTNLDNHPKERRITHQTIHRDDNRLKEPKDTRKISVTRNQILDDIDVTDPISVNVDTEPNKLGIHQPISRNISVTRDKILEDDVDISNKISEPNKGVNDQNGAIHIREDNVEIILNYIKSNDNKLDDIYNNYKKSKIKDNHESSGHITREHKLKDVKDDHYYEQNNIESIKNELYSKEDKIEKWKSTNALADFVPVKEKIHRLTSYEATNMKRAKSTAELDLGDAVKGKVKNMIVRMNSCDLLDDVKVKDTVEVINAKERPRKRSVSEKIALFERKLTPVAMENATVEVGRSLTPDMKPTNVNSNTIGVENVIKKANGGTNMTKEVNQNVTNLEANGNVEDIAAKIKELQDAKKTHGSVKISSMQLRDGRKMPVMALGTALLDPRLTKYIVAAAIDLGYRAIDTAFIYGTEKEVGEGIRMKIKDGTVKREDLFIMSKLWSTFHKPELVEGACRASLAALGLEYFDLFMIHNPMSFKEGGDPIPKIANVLQFSSYDYLDAWFAMEDLVSKGLVRSIGVSNFNSVQVTRILEKGRIKPVINQVECHPYLNQALLSDFCEARDVRLSCYGVLGSKGTPAEFKTNPAAVIDDAMVRVMAVGLNVSPAQLLIRYQIDRGHNVVVKASSAAHLWENLQALGVYLEPSSLKGLNNMNRNKRTFTFKGMGETHRNYPFTIAF